MESINTEKLDVALAEHRRLRDIYSYPGIEDTVISSYGGINEAVVGTETQFCGFRERLGKFTMLDAVNDPTELAYLGIVMQDFYAAMITIRGLAAEVHDCKLVQERMFKKAYLTGISIILTIEQVLGEIFDHDIYKMVDMECR